MEAHYKKPWVKLSKRMKMSNPEGFASKHYYGSQDITLAPYARDNRTGYDYDDESDQIGINETKQQTLGLHHENYADMYENKKAIKEASKALGMSNNHVQHVKQVSTTNNETQTSKIPTDLGMFKNAIQKLGLSPRQIPKDSIPSLWMFLENSRVSDREKQTVINNVSRAQSRKEKWDSLIPDVATIGLHDVGPRSDPSPSSSSKYETPKSAESKSRLFTSP